MTPPNILVFLTDDHGQWASSAYGNREIHSPAMQWLADTGARMNHAFCPLPVCSPARASFWTGQIPSRHGVHDWLQEPNEDPVHHGIAGQRTLAQYLREAGYRTGLVGKWHAGDYWKPMPGFDTWFTSAKGTNAIFGPQSYYEGTDKLEFFGHQETILTDRALRFLHEQRSEPRPFFLFVGFTNTHTPHTGETAPLVNHYRKCRFEDIPLERYDGEHGKARIERFDRDDPTRQEGLAHYYAAVESIDQQMVRIISALEDMGQLDNTLIVYTGDHGHMNGHHGLHTKGNATIPNNFLDESILVPALLRLPGVIQPGQAVEHPVDHCDLWATLLDIAGVDARAAAEDRVSPGRSYLPILKGEQQDWRDYQICEHGPSWMLRTATAKLIRRFPNKAGIDYADEFYDLAVDPRENRNVIGDPRYAGIIAQFDVVLREYFERYGDPAMAGTNMETILPHNYRDPWKTTPDEPTHRQN